MTLSCFLTSTQSHVKCGKNKSVYMGTVRSWPEPVTEHLVKGQSQPWEHRCEEFTLVTSQTSFTGWQPRGKVLYMEIASFRVFSSEPLSSEQGKLFLFCYRLVTNSFLGLSENWSDATMYLYLISYNCVCPFNCVEPGKRQLSRAYRAGQSEPHLTEDLSVAPCPI